MCIQADKQERATGRPMNGYTIIVSVMRNDDSEYGTREVSVGPEAFDQPKHIERTTLELLRAAKEQLNTSD